MSFFLKPPVILQSFCNTRPLVYLSLEVAPASWGANADAFRPQRWLDSPATGGAPSTLCWLPFGAGPRGCLGTRLGLTEVVIATALLLQVARPHALPPLAVRCYVWCACSAHAH